MPITDRYGHSAGDQVIRHVAALLRQRARANDVVCRYGGEEFLVLLGMEADAATTDKAMSPEHLINRADKLCTWRNRAGATDPCSSRRLMPAACALSDGLPAAAASG